MVRVCLVQSEMLLLTSNSNPESSFQKVESFSEIHSNHHQKSHSICCWRIRCCVSGIIFDRKLVKDKDQTLRLCKLRYYTGKIVVLDSEFFVTKALIELCQRQMIKKRRYWPRNAEGETIKRHFDNKKIGDVEAQAGQLDGVPYHVFGLKEENYVMQMMRMYGTLKRIGK